MGYYHTGKYWSDEQLWSASKDKSVTLANTEELLKSANISWNIGNMYELAKEIKQALNVDTSYPIIKVNEIIADGLHRLLLNYLHNITNTKVIILSLDDLGEPEYDEYKAINKKNKAMEE